MNQPTKAHYVYLYVRRARRDDHRTREPHAGRFIAYYRVSTDKQGRSGLGLEAQQTAVTDFLNGGDWTLIASYTEVEFGP